MKRKIIILFLLFVLCGCGKDKTECTYDNEKDENMKSYMKVTLISEKDVVQKEELYAVYKFKDSESAEKQYSRVEEIFDQDESVSVKQQNENIIAEGEKDVTNMQYDKESKVSYYEQLGYTCK